MDNINKNVINKEEDKEKLLMQKREEYVNKFKVALQKIALDSTITKTKPRFMKYGKQEVYKYLSNPITNQENLRNVVKYLIASSPQFNCLCNYLPNMALFNLTLTPVFEKYDLNESTIVKIQNDYLKVAKELEKMNINHEFKKIITTNFYFDTFFGYEIETKDSYFIKQLDPKYCRIYAEEDGCFLIEFDFSYFSSREKLVLGDELGRVSYPEEFKKKYLKFKNATEGKDLLRWQPLEYGIATKVFENFIDYSIPPFIGLFGDLSDIEDYKQLDKAGKEADNYKLIALKIPLNEKKNNGEDDFLVSMDLIYTFMDLLEEQIPEGVGFFPTPLEPKEITFQKDSTSTKTSVQDATENLFDTSGFCRLLFSGADNSTALKYSIKVDEQRLFPLYEQLQAILNRRMKRNHKGKFRVKILHMSEFSIDDTVDRYSKNISLGVPNKTELMASLGMTPLEMICKQIFENNVLKLHENWIPPASSYTQSNDEGGRPTKSDEDISEAGQQTREVDGNQRVKS